MNKITCITLLVFAIVSGYIGYLMFSAYYSGIDMLELYENLMFHLEHPFQNYWNEYSIWGILSFLLIYILIVMYYMLGKKEYMFGREYGSAKFADPLKVNRELADLDDKREDNIVVKRGRRNKR